MCVTGFMTLFFNTAQNQWIRQNVIDPHSNFLFCRNCITAVLGVHSERLHKQRTIKQQLKENQIVVMTKEDVIDKRLENYVLQSDEGQPTFAAWWKSLDGDDEVEVQFPHERHSLAGRVSNHHKEGVMADFLQFVDANSQPNGRQQGSYSAQFFFHPKFTRIAPPRAGEKNYNEKARTSIVHVFNSAQRGRGTCGPTACCY